MHKLGSDEISLDSFSFESFKEIEPGMCSAFIGTFISLQKQYNNTKDKKYWRALVEILPNGWNQKRTITLNYQVLRSMYFARRYHKLDEWKEFCNWVKTLPYAKELICYEGGK